MTETSATIRPIATPWPVWKSPNAVGALAAADSATATPRRARDSAFVGLGETRVSSQATFLFSFAYFVPNAERCQSPDDARTDMPAQALDRQGSQASPSPAGPARACF